MFFCIFLFTHIFPTLIISNAGLGTEDGVSVMKLHFSFLPHRLADILGIGRVKKQLFNCDFSVEPGSSFVAEDLPSVAAQSLDGDVYPVGGGALFPDQLVVDGKGGEVAEVLFALLP